MEVYAHPHPRICGMRKKCLAAADRDTLFPEYKYLCGEKNKQVRLASARKTIEELEKS